MDIPYQLTESQNSFLDKTLNHQVWSQVNDSKDHYKLYIKITFRWSQLLSKLWMWKSIFQNQSIVQKLVYKLELTGSQFLVESHQIFAIMRLFKLKSFIPWNCYFKISEDTV